MGAYRKIALSFKPLIPGRIGNAVVTPPILRKEIQDLEVSYEDFILGYMVNDGYSREIIEWSQNNPSVKLEIFWDKKDEPETKQISPALTFHQLNADKFLNLMARCKGLVTTAGFESICESMYLGKPVLMIPVAGQYEQACNAIEASKAGAGIQDSVFDISGLIEYIPTYRDISKEFRKWYHSGPRIILEELTGF